MSGSVQQLLRSVAWGAAFSAITLPALAAPARGVVTPVSFEEEAPAPAGEVSVAEPAPIKTDETVTEVIRERFPNGAIKTERHVAQDAEGNYFNHGLWTQWDEKGRLLGTGALRHGKREGRWARAYAANEGEMFRHQLYEGFKGPYSSEAEFEHGELHGMWRTYDSLGRKMSEFTFERGKRNGKSTWFFSNGQRHREVEYKADQTDGELLEWNNQDQLVVRDRFTNGRKLTRQTSYYSPEQKKSETWILMAREVSTTTYDWWNGSIRTATVGKDGVDQKQGPFTAWHSNGQKLVEGRYEANEPVGKFTWWFVNGQKQLEGEYVEGKESGRFVWWHPNGQRQIDGHYLAGAQSGKWMRWNPDGKVIEVGDYSDVSRQIDLDKTDLSDLDRQISQPALSTPSNIPTPSASKGPKHLRR